MAVATRAHLTIRFTVVLLLSEDIKIINSMLSPYIGHRGPIKKPLLVNLPDTMYVYKVSYIQPITLYMINHLNKVESSSVLIFSPILIISINLILTLIH